MPDEYEPGTCKDREDNAARSALFWWRAGLLARLFANGRHMHCLYLPCVANSLGRREPLQAGPSIGAYGG